MLESLRASRSMIAPLRRCSLTPIVLALSPRVQCSNNLISAIRIGGGSKYYSRPSSKCFKKQIRPHSSPGDAQPERIMSKSSIRLPGKQATNEINICDKISQEREYKVAIEELNSLQSNSRVLALAKYKRPETILPIFKQQLQLAGIDVGQLDKLRAIHVSGTKGKGSTCAFLESILLSNSILTGSDTRQLKVGSYNSPHLMHVTERIRLNGKPIEKPLFTKYFRHIFDKLKRATECEQVAMPSYFSFLTILAFHIFLEENVDCAIVEVGIGGEYDPTNVLRRPVACAITTLDLDHTNILGNTIKSIAWTKAGIIKPGAPLFTIEHEQMDAVKMIKARANQVGSPVYFCKPFNTNEQDQLGIQGSAQAMNASIACHLALHLLRHLGNEHPSSPIQWTGSEADVNRVLTSERANLEMLPETFRVALSQTRLPGRCQIVECSKVIFFLDGAHTKKSMENCLEWFQGASYSIPGQKRPSRYLMVNVIGERNKAEVLKPLLKYHKQFDKIIFTSNRVDPACTRDGTCSSSDTFATVQDSSHEKGSENVMNNANIWQGLVRLHGETDLAPQLLVRPSIMDSIQAIITDQEASSKCDQCTGRDKPHILATGSLHFVGAILEAIEKLDKD